MPRESRPGLSRAARITQRLPLLISGQQESGQRQMKFTAPVRRGDDPIPRLRWRDASCSTVFHIEVEEGLVEGGHPSDVIGEVVLTAASSELVIASRNSKPSRPTRE